MREQNDLSNLSDDELLSGFRASLLGWRKTQAETLAHLGEVEARDGFREAGARSMFEHCTEVLNMDDEEAVSMLATLEVASRIPRVIDAIAEGRTNPDHVAMLRDVLTAENFDAVVAEAQGKTNAEIVVLVSRLLP